MGESVKFGFLDPATHECQSLVSYHDLTMVVAVGVMAIVMFYLFVFLFSRGLGGYTCSALTKHNDVEMLWTVSPGFLLGALASLSWVNLYVMEVGSESDFFAKVVARQWFWEFEYYADGSFLSDWETLIDISAVLCEDFEELLGFMNVESYGLTPEDTSSEGSFDLLPFSRVGTTDAFFNIPLNKMTEVSISTGDVIHSFGVPGMGVKMDAVPGRTNHLNIFPFAVGVWQGNCYELCGYGHSVMPLSVRVVTPGKMEDLVE
nr:cytochrome c oxidase subunit 2 [Xylophagaidae sp. E23]UPX88982.1 cytochrome c oxidase subunit 2 [Xylophagaidae sp. E81]